VEIPIGARFAQIVFIRMQSASEKGYEERSGNYQDQRGITLEPKKLM
jgi:deoxycytidine triphosphate deaminase